MSDEGRQLFDVGLQPERTALAWRRTGLALTVAALVAVRILPEALGTWAVVPAGFGVAAAVGVLVAAHRRHVAVHRALVHAGPDETRLPTGLLPLAVAVLVAGGGIAALVVVLASGGPGR